MYNVWVFKLLPDTLCHKLDLIIYKWESVLGYSIFIPIGDQEIDKII